jgi:diguanylate cyclase (GGDEF)-like protein
MEGDSRIKRLLADAERLLLESQPQRPSGLGRRELRVEAALCAVVLLAAIAWPLAASGRPVALSTVAACVVAYAAAARVVLYVGAGSALATQLAFVPMLWILPLPAVPLCVVVALWLATLPDVLVRRHPVERLVTSVGDSAYAFAPALVMVAAGAPDAGLPRWGLVLLAFAAQCGSDVLLSIGREWLGRGIRPSVQLTVMATVYGVDALLLPVAVAIAERAEHEPLLVLAVVPFSILLGAIARDRTRRLDEAVDRLEQLEQERYRVGVAIHRTGRSLGSSHDRVAMLEVALGTAVDAVAAAAGRARMAGTAEGMVFEALPGQPGAAESAALLQVERAALAGHPHPTADTGGWHAMARPLVARRDAGTAPLGAIAVCRAGTPFTAQEDVLFAYLVAQTAASIDSIDVHERLQSQLTVDAVTGLANRRRFQDLLRTELERAQRNGAPLALVVLDVDGLDAIAVRHGLELGDAVLREVGAVVSARCRITDEPARYRPDRIGILLPGTALDAAVLMGEEIRLGIAAQEVAGDGTTVGVTASVGVAALQPALETGEALLWAAESAVGEARRGGGDRTVAARPHRAEERRSRLRPPR